MKTQSKSEKIAELLALFPSLPDEARVPIQVVCLLRGRSRASIWRDVTAGKLHPIRDGARCTRFLVGELRSAA